MVSMRSEKKFKYSPMEEKLLRLLPKGGKPITSSKLAEKIYSRDVHASPLFARESVRGIMASLIRKTKLNREPYVIERSERAGPHPLEYRKVEK